VTNHQYRKCRLCDEITDGGDLFYHHLEKSHHIPINRDRIDGNSGTAREETDRECLNRFRFQHPKAGGRKCKCPSCNVDTAPRAFAIWSSVGLSKN
jgi:hypothetical protein